MLAGVSHDLRTPLTRMKLQLSMMPSDETTHDLLSDITEMEQMLNAYLAFARGEGKEEPQKILYGGPMMGVAVYTTADPILKNTNAIVALNRADAEPPRSNPCIHCGRCVSACPMGLNPTLYARAMTMADSGERAARLEEAKIGLCIECGCCSFVCPSKRPLVEHNRLGKADLRAYQAKQAALAKNNDKEVK